MAIAACAIAVCGWRLLWFLTDDAFISFRYAANWVAGIGPTWNPPPFQPVEGYSNFSWVALLSLLWRSTGLEPPQIANLLSLFFGLGTVLLSALWLQKIIYRAAPTNYLQHVWFLLSLLLIVCNKSFLTWLSSGLETALFTFLMVSWAYAYNGRGGALSTVHWPAAAWLASLLALTRPDGLLFWGLTLGTWIFFELNSRHLTLTFVSRMVTLVGLTIVPIHVLWRRAYYGDWLPNTYYAKVHAAWPEMGAQYLQSYVIEYALYLPLSMVLIGGVWMLKKQAGTGMRFGAAVFGWILVSGGIAAQIGYYTLIVGGDHFEYRVFHHLAPLTVISICALLAVFNRLAEAPGVAPMSVGAQKALVSRTSLFALSLWLLLQSMIPWTHWYYSRNLYTRAETFAMAIPIADKFVPPFRSMVQYWDRLQAHMVAHAVGTRHQEHKVFYLFQRALFPARADGLSMPWTQRNVLIFGSVGLPGWVFPNAAIIDSVGLNDKVLAKNSPEQSSASRIMAHSIEPSRKYLNCYLPNIVWSPEQFRRYGELSRLTLKTGVREGAFDLQPAILPRSEPLNDEKIHSCEQYAWTRQELYNRVQ
jgi:arabinofuranosyltransferase